LLVVALALVASGCSALPGSSSSGYHLTAYFSRAVALYPQSKLKVMGVDAGIVDKIAIDGERIRVDMTVDDDVPLPADVHATIAAITLIGERNVVLGPAWKPGQPKAKDGDVIPQERTTVPVEPDEALQALTDLAKAIDPQAVARLVTGAANALDGKGKTINQLLDQAAGVTSTLATQDQQLVEVATNLHNLASTLNSREQQLGAVIDSFSTATGVLASERQNLSTFLGSIVRLTNAGQSIIDAYGGQLPGDIATLTQLGLTFQTDIDSIGQLVEAFPAITELLGSSWDPEHHRLRLRISLGPTGTDQLQNLFAPLLGGLVPCIPVLGQACP
jgi:phospholipid/cholesterol/gamma-HCH transport system substrate-binding protein